MSFFFGDFSHEIEKVLAEVNSYNSVIVQSIDDLRSGIVIANIIAKIVRKLDITKIYGSRSKEILMNN